MFFFSISIEIVFYLWSLGAIHFSLLIRGGTKNECHGRVEGGSYVKNIPASRCASCNSFWVQCTKTLSPEKYVKCRSAIFFVDFFSLARIFFLLSDLSDQLATVKFGFLPIPNYRFFYQFPINHFHLRKWFLKYKKIKIILTLILILRILIYYVCLKNVCSIWKCLFKS